MAALEKVNNRRCTFCKVWSRRRMGIRSRKSCNDADARTRIDMSNLLFASVLSSGRACVSGKIRDCEYCDTAATIRRSTPLPSRTIYYLRSQHNIFATVPLTLPLHFRIHAIARLLSKCAAVVLDSTWIWTKSARTGFSDSSAQKIEGHIGCVPGRAVSSVISTSVFSLIFKKPRA